MKLYYRYNKYKCLIESESNNILSDVVVKLTVDMPLNDYLKMTSDIRDSSMEFHFRILVNKSDHDFKLIKEGLWLIDSKVIKGMINSKSSNDNVEIIFRISIRSLMKDSDEEKSKLILNDIFESEKGE